MVVKPSDAVRNRTVLSAWESSTELAVLSWENRGAGQGGSSPRESP